MKNQRFKYGCEIICNENDVFPAMKALVEDEGLSVNAAAQYVHEDSDKQVTKVRARDVYRRRVPDVAHATPDNPPKKHTNQDTKIQLWSVVEEIKQGAVSDDDIKIVGDAIADSITSGKAAVRVGTKVETAVKKQRRSTVKRGKKKDLVSNLERLSKHVLSAAEGLTFLADGEIEPEHEDDQTYFKIIRKAAPTIILQYARLGIDVVAAAEFAMIHCNEKGDTIDVKQLKSANVGH